MADLSELLANSDPEALKKLLDLRDRVNYESPLSPSEVETSADYGKLFGKQVAQDVVDTASMPGKSAAQSAEVFSKALPEAGEAASAAAPSAGSRALGMLGKAAGPLSVGYEALKSAPNDEGSEDALVGQMREAYGNENGRMPEDRFEDVKALGSDEPNSSKDDGSGSDGGGRDLASSSDPYYSGLSHQLEEARMPAPGQPSAQGMRELVARATGKIPVESRMNTGDAIANLLGQRNAQLSSAQGLRNNLELLAGLGRAGSTIGAALTPMGRVKPDEEGYRAAMAQAQHPVADVQAQQAMQSQQIQEIQNQTKLKKELDAQNPESSDSQAFRNIIGQAAPWLKKAMGDHFDSISAADKPYIFDVVKLKEQQDTRRMLAEQTKELKAARMGTERTDKQNKAESDAYQHALSFRGNAAAQQASKDVLSADKAIRLIDRPGMKTTQDLRLIAEEMGKFASGGVPGEHGTEAIMPSNARTKMAELTNFLSSKPTDAQADAYLKRNKDYLQDAIGVSKNVLSKYQLGIAEGFKNRLTPEAYNKLVKTIKSQYEEERAPAAQGNMVKVRNTQTGQVHDVPKDQVKDALAAGGELVQ